MMRTMIMLLLSISATVSSISTDHLSSSNHFKPSGNVTETEKVTATDIAPSQPTPVKNAVQTARQVTADGAQQSELPLAIPSSQSIYFTTIDAENIDPRLERCWQHQVQGIWLACSAAGVLWLKYQTPDTTRVLRLVPLTGSLATLATLAASQTPPHLATFASELEHFTVVLAQRLAGASPLPAEAGWRWWWHDSAQVFHIDERCVWSMLQSSTTQTSPDVACKALPSQALPVLPNGWQWQPMITVGHSAGAGQPDWISLIALDRKTQQQPFMDASREPARITLWSPQLRLQSTQSAQGAIAIWQYVPNSLDNEKIGQDVPNGAERVVAHGEAHGSDHRPALWNAPVPSPRALWQQLHFVMPSAMRPDAGPWLQPGATTAAPWFYLLDRQGMVLQLIPTPSVTVQNSTLQNSTVPSLPVPSLPMPRTPHQTDFAPTSPIQTYQSRLVADLRQLHAHIWPTLQVFRHQHSGMVSSIDAQATPAAAHDLADNPAASRMTHDRNLSRHLALSPTIPSQRLDHEQLLLQASPLRPLTTSGPVATGAQNKLDGATLSYKPKSQSISRNGHNGFQPQAPRYGHGHYLISLDTMPEQPAIGWDDLQNADHPQAMATGVDLGDSKAIVGWYSFQTMAPLQAPFVIAGVLYQPLRHAAGRFSAAKDITAKDTTAKDITASDETGPDASARFALMARHLYLGAAIYTTTTASIAADTDRHRIATSPSVNTRHFEAASTQWHVAQAFFRPVFLHALFAPASAPSQPRGLNVATLRYWSSGQWQLKRLSLQNQTLNSQATPRDPLLEPTSTDEIALFYRVAGATTPKNMPEQPVIAQLQAITARPETTALAETTAQAATATLPETAAPCPSCRLLLQQAQHIAAAEPLSPRLHLLPAPLLPPVMPLAQAQPAVTWQRLATYMFEMEDF